MRDLVSGGKGFNDHLVLRRAMGVVMSEMGVDTELTLMLAGPHVVNDIARQFVNLTEDSFKGRGKKINYVHVPPKDVPWEDVDAVVSLVKPPQRNTVLGYQAEERGLDVHVFRF